MKQKKLKLWVKIILYIIMAGTISVFAFIKGAEIGKKMAEENMQSMATETDILVMDEEELEEIGEEIVVEEETYVFDPLLLVNKKHKLPDDYEVELKTMYDKVNRRSRRGCRRK